MTPDPFTEAARAEANRYWLETLQDETVGIGDLGEHMAEWARTHLAAQEPTDAEVEAAATAGLDAVSPTWRASMSRPAEDDLVFTRAALIRARAAR